MYRPLAPQRPRLEQSGAFEAGLLVRHQPRRPGGDLREETGNQGILVNLKLSSEGVEQEDLQRKPVDRGRWIRLQDPRVFRHGEPF